MIELGVMTRDGEIPPPAPPARLDKRLIRRLAVTVVAVFTVFTATGSAGSTTHIVRPLWSTTFGEGDSMTLDATTLYAGQRVAGRVTLKAYDLATGRVRWSVPTGDSTVPLLPVTGGVLVMPATFDDARIPQDDGTYLVQTQASSTIARDAATGRALWIQSGDSLQTSPASVLLGESDGQGQLTRLRVVGLRDGVTRWTKPVRGVDGWTVAQTGDRPTRIVLADPSGTLTVLDYADGSTVGTGHVSYSGSQQGTNGIYSSLEVIGDELVISRADSSENSSTVYRLDTLQKLWHADGYVIDCGVRLCTVEDTGLVGRDPVTGVVRWRRPELNGVWEVANGRILANAPSSLGPYQLIDPATGEAVGDPVRGEPAWIDGALGGTVVLVGTVAENARLNSVLQLDLDTGRSYLLGAIQEVANFGCQGTPGYLICLRPNGLDVTAVG